MAKEKKVVKAEAKIDEKIYNRNQNIIISLLVIACILMIIILMVVIKGHEAKLKDGKEVVASIKGKKITAEDLFSELKNQYGTNIIITTLDDFIANTEITDTDAAKEYAKAQLGALKQRYESSGYDFDTILTSNGYDGEQDLVNVFIADYKKNKVVENYLGKKVTDDEINDYYENEVYGRITAKHILIKPDTTSDMSDEDIKKAEEAAKAKAQDIINQLNNGAAWAGLVKEHSDDEGSREDEGLIENFAKDEVVDEFFEGALELKDGEYSKEPVKSTYGYHVILKVSQSEKDKLEDIKEDIITDIVSIKLSEDADLADKTWVTIREEYKLEINDTKLEKIYDSVIKDLK